MKNQIVKHSILALGMVIYISAASYASAMPQAPDMTEAALAGVTLIHCDGTGTTERCTYLKGRCANYSNVTLKCSNSTGNLTVRCNQDGTTSWPRRSGCRPKKTSEVGSPDAFPGGLR